MNTSTYIITGLIILVITGRLAWKHLTKPPRPMVRYIQNHIRSMFKVSEFDTDLSRYALPRPDDQLGGGLFKNPIRFGFKARYSFSHRDLYEKILRCSRFVPGLRVDQSLQNIIDGVDEFQMIERGEKHNLQYHVTLSSKRVVRFGASHCRVAVTVAYRMVSK